MKRGLLVLSVALVIAWSLPSRAAAGAGDDTRWVRGTVTAMEKNTITVKVRDKEMQFAVDKETRLIAEGAGTRTRQAQAEGRTGLQLTEFVKVGDRVELHYREGGAPPHAAEIRAAIGAGDAMGPEGGRSVRGQVTAVSASSLKLKAGNKEWEFTVDARTTVVGEGVGTMTREMREKGKGPALTDLVRTGDDVMVSYTSSDGAMHADVVRIARRARTSD
jgi:hypothetical protein